MNEPKEKLLDTMRKGSIFGTDPTLTHMDKRLVSVPETPEQIAERIGAKAEIVTKAEQLQADGEIEE